jgi:hypothetical protein
VKAIEADPSAADAFYGKALVLSSMGHQESAVSYYRKTPHHETTRLKILYCICELPPKAKYCRVSFVELLNRCKY